jgi:quercetin dioxygenase-like cupin family protein
VPSREVETINAARVGACSWRQMFCAEQGTSRYDENNCLDPVHSAKQVPVIFTFVHTPMTSPAAPRSVTWYSWNDMPRESVAPLLERRLITGDRMMLAHVYLKKGMIVPKHQHENEQITYILEGELKFWIGDDESQIVHVRAGEVLHIPSMVFHKAEAVVDTLDVDIFDPPRQDWLDKTDSYLRK